MRDLPLTSLLSPTSGFGRKWTPIMERGHGSQSIPDVEVDDVPRERNWKTVRKPFVWLPSRRTGISGTRQPSCHSFETYLSR